jgi:hypothetical protein
MVFTSFWRPWRSCQPESLDSKKGSALIFHPDNEVDCPLLARLGSADTAR